MMRSSLWPGARWLAVHLSLATTAILLAFSTPYVAIVFGGAEGAATAGFSRVLFLTQIILALALMVSFIGLRMAWQNRRTLVAARRTGILDASGNISPWDGPRPYEILANLPPASEVFLWSQTGCDTFARHGTPLFSLLPEARDIRVMLVNPRSAQLAGRPGMGWPGSLQEEIEDSIRCLESLRRAGKRVQLKFCDSAPLWKIAVVGDRVWVSYCHRSEDDVVNAEYVFALEPNEPGQGFFVPFYTYFLEHWDNAAHDEYDFDTGEIICRDASGAELNRVPLIRGVPGRGPERRTLRATGERVRPQASLRGNEVTVHLLR